MTDVLVISGVDGLVERLKRGVKPEDVKNAVKEHGVALQREAREIVPVKTGQLRDSLTLTLEDEGYTAVVGTPVEYASYVEYGTRFQTAKPYLRPALLKVKDDFIKDMKKMIRRR